MRFSLDAADKSTRWATALILIASAGTYFAVPSFQFVFDDRSQILNNPTLLHLSSIPGYFRHHVWSYMPEMGATYYRPLFSVWLNVGYALFGQHPAGWHLSLLGLHAVACAMSYYVVRSVFHNATVGLLAALLFAVHPVHVESVAWIAGATDPLAAIFLLGSYLAYRKSQNASAAVRTATYAASLVLFAGALLTKEIALLFPIVILLDGLLLVQPRAKWSALLATAGPYFLLTATYVLIRIHVLGHFSQNHYAVSPAVLFFTLPSVLLLYLRMLVVPARLSPFYDTAYVSRPDFLHFWMPLLILLGAVILGAVLISVVTGNTPEGRSERRACFFFVAWYGIFLLPALDLSALDFGEIVHDRYLYLPSLGLLAIIAFIMHGIATKMAMATTARVATAGTMVLALGVACTIQSYYWKNDLALYRRGASIAHSNMNAMNNLATVYLEHGYFEEGINLHRQILEKNPWHADSYFNIGLAYYNQGDFVRAESYLGQAVRLHPAPNSYFYLGLAQFKKGDSGPAEASLVKAIQGNPDNAQFHAVLGVLYKMEGKAAAALKEFQSAQQLDPGNQAVSIEAGKLRQQLHL